MVLFIVLKIEGDVFIVIENGYGKCISLFEYLIKGCGI